jgi:hypothetical protein
MAIEIVVAKLLRGTAAAWTSDNRILPSGVEAYETDTRKRKVGNGVGHYVDLEYDNAGGGVDQTARDAASSAASTANAAIPSAQKGAASGVATLDSSTKIPIAQIPTGTSSSTVAAGDAPAVAAASAVSSLTRASVGLGNVTNDAQVKRSEMGAASGVATLGSDGKLPAGQLPDVAISELLGTVASQVAMLALVGQKGDWCVRSDTSSAWIVTGADPTQLGSWTQMVYPGSPVSSVAGRTGAVTLAEGDITNLTTDLTARALKQSGTIDGLTSLGVRDTSAAHDVKMAAVSSTALTADRTLTLDLVNASRTVKVTANAEIGGVNTGDEPDTTERTISGTTDTFVLGDKNNIVAATNTSNTTGIVPLNSVVAFPESTIINVRASGTGTYTIAPVSGAVTVTGASLVIPAGQGAMLIQTSTLNTWNLVLVSLTSLGAQATLVSGTNIKTVNGTSILGSGNMTVSVGSAADLPTTIAAPYTPSSGTPTVTLDCSLGDEHDITGNAAGGALTIAASNWTNSQIVMVTLTQGSTAVTIANYMSGYTIRWISAAGAAPTLSAAGKKCTWFYKRTGASTCDGFLGSVET